MLSGRSCRSKKLTPSCAAVTSPKRQRLRPAEVADRAVPGHWEGDLIIGKNNGSAAGTLVERTTRFVLLLHLPEGREAEKVNEAMRKAIATLPAELVRSITWDQGKELSAHVAFTVARLRRP